MGLRYGKVSFRGQSIVADSTSDVDVNPDVQPLVGYVDFTPSRAANYDKADGILKVIQPVTAGIDAFGVMRDGQGSQTVTLVSPLSPDLLHQDWTWKATFRTAGASVGPFTFTLAIGQTKNLADESKLMSLVVEIISTEIIDYNDGSVRLTGDTTRDNSDGTFSVNDNLLADNGDGTYSLTA